MGLAEVADRRSGLCLNRLHSQEQAINAHTLPKAQMPDRNGVVPWFPGPLRGGHLARFFDQYGLAGA
jgi:hypothetical protein